MSCNLSTSASTLNDQWVWVSFSFDRDDIVTALQRSEGVVEPVFAYAHRNFVVFDVNRTNESQHLVVGQSFVFDFLDFRVELWQSAHVLSSAFYRFQGLRDKRLHREGSGRLHLQARDSGQNSDFSGDIQAVQVVSWVRLSVAQLFSDFDDIRELGRVGSVGGGEFVEDVRQGSREDTLDLFNFITSGN